jgi:hypothetical protein
MDCSPRGAETTGESGPSNEVGAGRPADADSGPPHRPRARTNPTRGPLRSSSTQARPVPPFGFLASLLGESGTW